MYKNLEMLVIESTECSYTEYNNCQQQSVSETLTAGNLDTLAV